ncbi:hypothetical protein [Mycolicibacterium madagascariense]|uniref:hypothetical protein n=1 Tax=Mycolicibacterium madagascariense TaxID=212765 RepID=UPI0013D32CCC|nr:hypothetical protein [Mycolicibacterium madagascariense]MCV7011793.1 hypothetical protein [Mycolicibacterium madagascariense]
MRRMVAAAVAAVASTVVCAGPAAADDFTGTYSVTLIGATGQSSWSTRTACAPAGSCVAHVTSSVGWSGNATLSGNRWTMTVARADGHSCPDGTRHAEMQTWSWDATTLDGEVGGVSTDPASCPVGQANSFSLTRMRVGGTPL